MRNHLALLSLTCLLLCFSCSRKGAYPGIAWEKYQSPTSIGFKARQLAKVTEYIKDSSNTTALVALYDGKVIYEYGDVSTISYIASCRKSVLSMLYGKYVDNGTIDLNQTIGSMGIDEADGLLDIEKRATVDHIITSRSGVFHEASNGGYDKENFLKRGSVEPGGYFVYNNWDFNVAGHLFEQYAGKSIYQEVEEQLAIPLGFQDWNIKNQRKSGNKKKSQYKAYHMYFSTRDMAKIGQLMLNEGEWDGQQLISKEWVKKTISTVTPLDTMIARFGPANPMDPHMSYGYMWWLIDNYQQNPAFEGAYTAIGYGGQYITVLPAANMVFAHKTKLSLGTLLGITYKETSGNTYFNIMKQVIAAKS